MRGGKCEKSGRAERGEGRETVRVERRETVREETVGEESKRQS